jgi:acyl-CoA reductase-like NAD-dependent aldehyde dehydrogenase
MGMKTISFVGGYEAGEQLYKEAAKRGIRRIVIWVQRIMQ